MSSPVITVGFNAATGPFNKGLSAAQKKLGGFDKSARKASFGVGTLVKGFAAFQGVQIAKDFLGGAIKSSSDAQQSLGATQTVFKDFSKTVVKDSKRASKAFGLSSNEYRENANLIGSLFKNQGVATDQLASKSKEMIGVASDLAATFGGTTKDAVESLGAAYKGEFNQLEKYGISLKQSTINTEAMRVANVGSTSEFNKLSGAAQAAAKQQATSNLVMKQSKDSAGAFARETGTLAHQQQVLSAQFDNVKVAVGSRLLPALTSVMQFMTSDLPGAYRKAKQGLQDFLKTPVGMKGLSVIKDAAEAIGDGFDASIKKLDEFRDKVGTLDLNNLDGKKIGKALTTAVGTALSGIGKLGGKLVDTIGKLFEDVDFVGIGIDMGKQVPSLLLGLVAGIISFDFGGLLSGVADNWSTILIGVITVAFAPAKLAGAVAGILAKIPLVGRFLAWMVTALNGVGQKILPYITGLFKGLWAGITNGSRPGIISWIGNIVGLLRGLPGRAAGALKDLAGLLYVRAYQAMFRLGTAIRAGIIKAVKFLAGLPGKAVSAVKALVSLLPGQATSAMSRMGSAITSGISKVVTAAKGIPGRVKGALSDAGSWLKDAATNVITGFVNGMRDKAAALIPNAVKGVADKVKSGFKKALSIFSPSRVTRAFGRYVTEGLALGMLDRTDNVVKSVNKLARVINEDLPKKLKSKKSIRKWYAEHEKDIKAGTKAVLKALTNSAKARLQALQAQSRAYSSAVRDAARSYASLSNIELGENENLTGGTVKQFLTDRLAQIRNFNAKLAILKKKGISNDLYNQIVQMGVDQGSSYANALANETPAAIRELNNLQTQINGASTSLGNSTASAMYKSGIDAAAGFYNGLKTLVKKVASMGTKISKSLLKSLKKALGIRSPSRKMMAISDQVMAGMLKPLDERVIATRGVDMAKAFARGYANSGPVVSYKAPKQAQVSTTTLTNSGGGGTTIILQAGAVQVDNSMTIEQQGVAITKAIKAAEKAGMVR